MVSPPRSLLPGRPPGPLPRPVMSECVDLCAPPGPGFLPGTSPSGVFSRVTPVLAMPTLPPAQTALSRRLKDPATPTQPETPVWGGASPASSVLVLCQPHILISANLLALPPAGPPTSRPDSGTGHQHLLSGTFQLVHSLPSRPHPPQSTLHVARGASPRGPAQSSGSCCVSSITQLSTSQGGTPPPYSKSQQRYPLTPHALDPDPASPFMTGSDRGTYHKDSVRSPSTCQGILPTAVSGSLKDKDRSYTSHATGVTPEKSRASHHSMPRRCLQPVVRGSVTDTAGSPKAPG